MKIKEFFEIAWETLILSIITMAIGVVIGIVIGVHYKSESLSDIINIIIPLVILLGITIIFNSIILTIRVKAIAMRFKLDVFDKDCLNEETSESNSFISTEKVKKAPTPKEREIVMKLYKKGLTIEEISREMNLSKGEVELIIEITG